MSFDHFLNVDWNAGIILYETSVENIEEHNNRRQYEFVGLLADNSDQRALHQVLVNMALRLTARARGTHEEEPYGI